MQFVELAATSAAVTATSKRLAKIELLAGALRGLAPDEVVAGSAYLAGEIRQRQTGVGYASLRDLPPPAEQPTLSVADVDAAIGEMAAVSGPGSQGRRRDLLGALFRAATGDEQRMLVGLFSGELRQGAQAGVLADAIAKAAGVPGPTVRRALLLAGDLKAVAAAALQGGSAALAEFALQVGRPLAPMLAQSAPTIDEALDATGMPAAVDVKLDGIRIQVHRSGDDVAVFTRSLDEITPRLPEVVAAVRSLPVRDIVLDGEAMLFGADGRPRPFAETSSRAATRGARRRVRAEAAGSDEAVVGPEAAVGAEAAASSAAAGSSMPVGSEAAVDGSEAAVAGSAADGSAAAVGSETAAGSSVAAPVSALAGLALRPYFFDLLHLDGADLLDAPGVERWTALAGAVPAGLRVPSTTVDNVEAAADAYAAALKAGHEGVVIKSLTAPYDAGRRGAAWVKVKPRHTLDLVVLAVEWGSGRRTGWLSNLHLGARDPRTGGFVMLGKTFKGLTDELLKWQTERFQELAVDRGDWVVTVRPEQVVEIAFDGVQRSPRYPGGVALRFARVVRYRDDKSAAEADTIDVVQAIYNGRN